MQRIAPTKPTADEEKRGRREKRFLPGGRKSGLWHLIGSATGADLVLICEGYATGASLHEATGRPVAVAFDAGNLAKVAQALQALHPAARLLIAGDDDRATEAKTGANPGRVKATAAARAVAGLAVFPEGLPEGASDFNDLAQHAGASAVGELIERAAGELLAGVVQARAPRGWPSQDLAQERDEGPEGADAPSADDDAPSGPAAPSPSPFDRFTLNGEGIFYSEHDQDGRGRELWVCSRLSVTARTRDGDGDGWGYLLEFDDPTGNRAPGQCPPACWPATVRSTAQLC